jgi:MoxR-like ATPase
VFGPFSLGNYIVKEPYTVTFRMPLPRMTDLIGRQKDMYGLVSSIMNINTHLLTLIGLPGVGKSALVKSTL